jgi:hypothetical protein
MTSLGAIGRLVTAAMEVRREEADARGRGSPSLVRALFTLVGVAVAGILIWLGRTFDLTSTNGFWAAMGLFVAAGLALGLSQLFGGWTKWGRTVMSPGVFLLAFIPSAIVVGWVLLATQPDGGWQQARFSGWTSDLGITGFVNDLGTLPAALATGLGIVFAFTIDTTGPRTRAVVGDERVTGQRIGLRSLIVKAQLTLFLAALLLPLSSWAGLDEPRAFAGVSVFPSDVIVLAAIGSAFLLHALSPAGEKPRMLSTPILGWPLLAFAVLLAPGIWRGYERYGESLVSQPARLVLYAGIAAAMTEISPRQAFRWITGGLYAGAVWQGIVLAGYHIATGTSQTPINILSTGGTRVLSLTTGMFLGTALVIAIVNIELEQRTRRRFVHALFGAIASVGIVLSFGRTTFLALAVVLLFLVWKLPDTRRMALRKWRWWVPALALLAVGVGLAMPSSATQIVNRVKANPLTDSSVRWRLAGIHATLAGMKDGRWDTRSGLLTADATGNHLINASYEFGTTGWRVQGGGIFTVPTNVSGFGARSVELRTTGTTADQGWYSAPVVAKSGQTWVHTVWLEGATGGERVNVSIWEYNDQEQAIYRAELPAVLTDVPQQYAVKTTVTDPDVTHIRALVRTTVPQRVDTYGDLATLRQITAPGARETRAITTSNSDGAILSPTIRGDEQVFGDNQANYARSGPNRLPNGGFEDASLLGGVQSGDLSQVDGFSRSLGVKSALLTTDGTSSDEGYYSAPVRVEPGQTWSFSVWLDGQGGEEMLVGMWLYKRATLESPIGNLNFPVTLSDRPAEYVATAVIPPGKARYVRAVVRTRLDPQNVSVLMDGAELRPLPAGQASIYAVEEGGTSYQIDEPLLGLGFGRETQYVWQGFYYRVEGDPDNSYVFLLAGGGILALGGFLFLLGSFVRDAFKRLRTAVGIERGLVVWALSAWFIMAVNFAMAPFLPRPKIVLSFWAVMLVAALVRRVRRERTD